MKKSTIVWIVIGVIVLILISWIVGGYNNFVTLDQNLNSKWSEVESQYQRQADLIPNLVSIVSSAVRVETNFTLAVTNARTRWQEASSTPDKDAAGVQMTNSVATFVSAVAENYPTLQANKQYTALMDEVAGTQNRITTARGRWIEAIQIFNTAIKRFPSNILAGVFGFSSADYYKAETLANPVLGTGVLP